MSVTRDELRVAEAFGRLAAKNRKTIHACPYEANGDADQRTLAMHFVKAYLNAGGRVHVDYEDGAGETPGTPPSRTGTTRKGEPVRVEIRRRPPVS